MSEHDKKGQSWVRKTKEKKKKKHATRGNPESAKKDNAING
jgi:hypothetical protein